ncbi:MAG: ketose-bisphosphate aldolase [Candidatus Accumulibacter sp.]|jgi:fructose-bisphosphate aldolase class II|nr:ketose-bisphosphate aldolase [Accumulibacter sp.]
MTIRSVKPLLTAAQREHRAVGAFNVSSLEMLRGAVQAAEETKTPIILQIAEKRLAHSPLHLIGPMMVEAAKQAQVDIAVQLDHGHSLPLMEQAVGYGFTAIMYDGSEYPLAENIEKTARMVQWAKDAGVDLEAEIGVLAGNEGAGDKQAIHTDPGEAVRLARETGCTALAVAIGNAHGHYAGKPKLDFAVLDAIRSRLTHLAHLTIPLVLHGGSGIPAEDFRRAIALGVRKINVATASLDAEVAGARAYLERTPHADYYGLNEAMTEAVRRNVVRHIHIFNNDRENDHDET